MEEPQLYNIWFEVATLFFLLIINIFLRIKYVAETRVNKEFRLLALLVLIACALDVTTAITIDYNEVIPQQVNQLLNTAYFVANVFVGFQFVRYVSAYVYREKHRNVGYWFNVGFGALCLVVLLVNLFVGMFVPAEKFNLLFSFNNAEHAYEGGTLYYFVYAFSYFFIVYSVGVLFVHFKQFTLKQRISIIVLFVLCMGGPLVQMLVQMLSPTKVLLGFFTIALGLLVCMFMLETPNYQRLMKTLAELSDLREHLQQEVNRQTEKSEHLSFQALKTLAVTIDAKDKYTNGHSVRVAEYAKELVRRSGGSDQEQTEIYYIALLHDIGKIGISDEIINKPGKLTEEEYDKIKAHPVIGADILKNISMDIPGIEVGARWHHERYAGGGYPDGLAGEKIPKVARIIGVADAYDAMTSKRSYRDVLSQQAVRSEFVEKSGVQFDPVYAKIMVEMIDADPDYKLKEQD